MQLRKFLRAVSSVVLVTFTSLCAQPTIAALQATRAKTATAPREPTADEKYANLLGELEEQSKKAKRNRSQAKPSKKQHPQRFICPSCKAEFPTPLKFCGECGKPMAAAQA